MAEVLVGAVLKKLANFTVDKVVEKALSLYGIRAEVEELSRNLNYIKAFIEDADRKHIVEKRQMQLVKDLIDIAYDIEDAIDIFHSECPEKLKLPGILGRLGRLPKEISKIPFLYQFQQEVKQIQSRISQIKEYKETWGITTLGEDRIPQSNPQLIPTVDDSEIVGFETHRDNVVKCLLDEAYKSLAVVSIVGSGGLGKTTLARKVYNSGDVSENFGKPIWITISQAYDLLKILQGIAKDLGILSGNTEDKKELAIKIREFLEQKRYLIVFDDVWAKDFWENIKNAMPDKNNGSRVLITTRFEEVAKKADTKYNPYLLSTLDNEQSLKLFLRKAVPKMHQCPNGPTDNLKSLAQEFVAKCRGLPLALIVLGSLLSTKPYDFHGWKGLLDTMSWQVDGSECIDVMATSYEYLPLAKKLCFLYFAAYPEDKEIKIEDLLRIWVAERLIPQEDTRTLEETAMCFLEDLVQRSMVQVSGKDFDGSIQFCRVHDVLRDLAIQKAKEINFLIVCSKPNDWMSCNKARRVAINYSSNVNELMGDYANPNLRSLLLFGDRSNLDCSKYKLLRVLGCLGWSSQRVVLRNFKGLPHLRYLKLNSEIEGQEREFGEWIRSMKYLETLDLGYSRHGDLSKWIWQVKTLRHAILNNYNTQAPPTSADLTNLQTLLYVNYGESRPASGPPNITQVRNLRIEVRNFSMEELITLLHNLKHLVNLDIRGISGIDLGKIVWKNFPFYENLKCLVIMGYHNEGVLTTDIDGNKTLVLRDDTLPPHLIYLQLWGFKFVSDPLSVLQKLQNLKTLYIWPEQEYVLMSWRFRCSVGGFKQLEDLMIYNLMVDEWEIERGAMPMLKRLVVQGCDPLRVPLELVHLPSLKDLTWYTDIETNKDMIRSIRKQRPDVFFDYSYGDD
ncbi:Disease resistance protein (CC-NBS-LRR class) family [Rhynchospora pubera]|uniref:Disease resistance protein (CC-NBS-LRR class) family n=1 Tax=Rhynchospora pubera TaxID=906938 RepID=A0AAV8GWE8_9POAL|nr:Disease resistance protein (CC-NBS-LRR class) family [Rhynchospora pubera]